LNPVKSRLLMVVGRKFSNPIPLADAELSASLRETYPCLEHADGMPGQTDAALSSHGGVVPILEANATRKVAYYTRSAKRTTTSRNSAQGEVNLDGGSSQSVFAPLPNPSQPGCTSTQGEVNSDGGSTQSVIAPLPNTSHPGCGTQPTSGPSTFNTGLSATLQEAHQRLDSANRRAGR